MQWFQFDVEDVFEKLATFVKGLTEAEQPPNSTVRPRQMVEEGQISRWKLLLHQFTSTLIYILMLAAVVTFFLEE